MRFDDALQQGAIRKSVIDRQLALSLLKSSENTLTAVKQMKLDEHTSSSIIREHYEALRQICEAIIALHGYKTYSHEVITFFLDEKLNEKVIASGFDRYRKIRNAINYYGRAIDIEETKKTMKEIPEMIKKLKEKYLTGVPQ